MRIPNVVTREEWLEARKAHLKSEKALTRMRDLVAADRARLPWVKVEKDYVFNGPEGNVRLVDLFGRNSQLIVHHFMWRHDLDLGCPSCSLMADHAEGALVHLENHDVSYVRISRAPLQKLMAYNKRMGWTAPWVSSWASDFNFDYGVSFREEDMASGRITYNYATVAPFGNMTELHGMSVFAKGADGAAYHTYSTYGRGVEEVVGAFIYLDMTPKGRNETEIMDWVKRHDEYDTPKSAMSCCAPARKSA